MTAQGRATLLNSGTIVAGPDGVGMLGGGRGSLGDDSTINNSGTIRVGACGAGINTSPGTGATIVNSGRILGSGCLAVGIAMGDGDTLSNSGLVSAPFSVTSAGAATVTNT